jgi:glycogen debranching enzyme
MIRSKRETCRDVEAAVQREWLETNGLGGFASSTIIGLNTRRYHGLLVVATKPPVGRLVLLFKLEETLFIDGKGFDLRPIVLQVLFTPRDSTISHSFVSTRFRSLRMKWKPSRSRSAYS